MHVCACVLGMALCRVWKNPQAGVYDNVFGACTHQAPVALTPSLRASLPPRSALPRSLTAVALADDLDTTPVHPYHYGEPVDVSPDLPYANYSAVDGTTALSYDGTCNPMPGRCVCERVRGCVWCVRITPSLLSHQYRMFVPREGN